MTAHNLLTEPLLSWRDTNRKRGMTTLPGVLARLASGELGDFPRVRAHQFHPWSMFLTQLAAIALKHAGKTDPRLSEDKWRELLLALTGGQHEPWCLVVEDLSKPAFFQPPVPEAKPGWLVQEHWDGVAHPDERDILVTSKAHDVKEARLDSRVPEFWVYVLVTLQTMQGYPGRGYNPISRMKGGYGNRPRVGLSADARVSTRWCRDVDMLLATWARLASQRGFRDRGVALVWTVPWDGATPLGFGDLAPHFIEICQRVRCTISPAGIYCSYTTTSKRRCLEGTENGDVGDPWIPIGREGGALTIGPKGYHYELLAHLLVSDDYEPAACQALQPGDGDPVLFIASAMARGQGKTEGLHERTLVLAGEARRRLGQPDQRATLGKRSAVYIEGAKRMRSKVLFPSLKALALGEKIVEDAFDSRVDEVFFSDLFAWLAQKDEIARFAWEKELAVMAQDEFERAIEKCALADAQRYRAISKAEGLFHFNLAKHFPDVAAQIHPGRQEPSQGVQR